MRYLILLALAGCAGTLQASYLEFEPNPKAFEKAVELWNDYQPNEVTDQCLNYIKHIEFQVLSEKDVQLYCLNKEAIACYQGDQNLILLNDSEEALSLQIQVHELIHALGDCMDHDQMSDHKGEIWNAVRKIR